MYHGPRYDKDEKKDDGDVYRRISNAGDNIHIDENDNDDKDDKPDHDDNDSDDNDETDDKENQSL